MSLPETPCADKAAEDAFLPEPEIDSLPCLGGKVLLFARIAALDASEVVWGCQMSGETFEEFARVAAWRPVFEVS